MLEEFKKYVSKYNLEDVKIKGKYEHSLRVRELSLKYARLLGFNEEDIKLAEVIGLLHDFGRFEQLRVYDSFNDLTTIDHADYSVEQLFSKDEIKKYVTDESWYPIIKFAIKNHNKVKIEETDDERFLKHAYLIRDADKTDIMRSMSVDLKKNPDDSVINDKVMDAIRNHKTVDRKLTETLNDRIATQYAFAFDIHSDVFLKEFKENFINYHNSLVGNEKLKEVYDEVIKYLDERIDKYEGNRN